MVLDMVPDDPQNGPRMTLRMDPPDWSPDGLQIPDILTSDILYSRIGTISAFIDHC